MDNAKMHACNKYKKKCQDIRYRVVKTMMDSEDCWERDRVEEALKNAREELIRRYIGKLIFKNTISQLVHITYNYNIERQEALEVIMDDAQAFLKPLSSLKSQILPGIYPVVYSLHLYP